MSDVYGYILAVILAALVAFGFGWVTAHEIVATECTRLGSFYVGQTIFECKVKP